MHRTIVTGLLIAASATPAAAQDAAEKVGIAAALGLTAGTGKTMLGDNAGSIEAALLNTDAIDQAGRIVAGVVRGRTSGKVLVVGRTDTVDLITGPLVRRRVTSLTSALRDLPPCPKFDGKPDSAPVLTLGVVGETGNAAGNKAKVQLSDITAALATDVTVATIKVNVDDRMLIQSIAVNQQALSITKPSAEWALFKLPKDDKSADPLSFTDDHRSEAARQVEGKTASFVVPAEVTASTTGPTLDGYEKLLEAADTKRQCLGDKAKALVTAADAFVTSINAAPEGGGATPLGRAIQTEAFADASRDRTPTRAKRSDVPLILRVVAEEAGGTSIVSANIWYTLGFPGAATVSAGLIVSFRLVDPTDGSTVVAGMIRCAALPISIKRVQTIIEAPVGTRTTCAYRTSG